MDKKQQLLQTVSLGNQATSRILTKYRTGSQNVEIATLSRGLMGNPNSPSLQTIYRRWNQSRGVFYWVNAVSYRMCASTMIISEEKHTWFSSESPESPTRKEKGQWVLLPSRSLIPWMVAWLMVKCRIRLVSFDKHPFTSLWLVSVNVKRSLGEFLGFSLPLPQSLWQHMT